MSSTSSDDLAALRAMVPGTKEFILKELAEIASKEAEQFRSAVGPRGAPVMVNPKTGEKEYGHNAKRIQHVKEHGDKREEGGEYRRTKDLQMPHGHESQIEEKGLFSGSNPAKDIKNLRSMENATPMAQQDALDRTAAKHGASAPQRLPDAIGPRITGKADDEPEMAKPSATGAVASVLGKKTCC